MREEAFDFLSRNGWLAGTSSVFRTRVLNRCRVIHVTAGDKIYNLGDSTGGIWGIAAGGLYLETAVGDSLPRVSFYHRPGFWTGVAAMAFNAPRRAGFSAARPSVLAYLSRVEFDRLAAEEPETWRWMTQLAATNAVLAMSVAHDMMIRDQNARTAALLLQLGGCRVNAASEPTEIWMSQDGIAGIVNLSRSSLNEILQRFENEGWIALGYRKVTIIKDAPLRTLVDHS